ncbi:MAG: hypothetical protein KatS3mg129_2220 [Leptospiraceae bacterium]|nr:MAG: hypothetical protein KatS3mg129_2220 [Leptospiraceae bacterium]
MQHKLIYLLMVIGLLGYCNQNQQVKKEGLKDYRQFYHVKTLILEEGHPLYKDFGGIHHIYANEKAYQAYKNKTKFPEGSLIVFDLLEVVKKDNTVGEGTRKVLAYMKKTNKNPDTGNWEFQAYAGGDLNKPVVTDAKNQCFACHQSVEKNDYVFSAWRE